MSINIKTMQFIKHEGSISTEATTEGTTPTPATNSEVVIALGTKSAGFDCYLTQAKVQEQAVEGEKVETALEKRAKAVDELVMKMKAFIDVTELANRVAAVRTALKSTNTVEGIEEFLEAHRRVYSYTSRWSNLNPTNCFEQAENIRNFIKAFENEDEMQLLTFKDQVRKGLFVSAWPAKWAELNLTVNELKTSLTTMDTAKKNEPAEKEAAQKKAEEERKAAGIPQETRRMTTEEAIRKSRAVGQKAYDGGATKSEANWAFTIDFNKLLGEEVLKAEEKLRAEHRSNHPIAMYFYTKSIEMKNEEFRYMALSLPVGEFNTSKIECPTFTVDLSKLTGTTNMVDGEVTTYTFDSLPSGAVTTNDGWSLPSKIAVAASAIGVVGVIGLIAYKFFGSSKVDEAEEHLVV